MPIAINDQYAPRRAPVPPAGRVFPRPPLVPQIAREEALRPAPGPMGMDAQQIEILITRVDAQIDLYNRCSHVVTSLYDPRGHNTEERRDFQCSVDQLTGPLRNALEKMRRVYPEFDLPKLDQEESTLLFDAFLDDCIQAPAVVELNGDVDSLAKTALSILKRIDQEYFCAER